MKVNTSRFGEIEVPDESLITFPEGIIGFKEARGFVLFDCGEEGLFKWMQSVDQPELAFVICEANLIVPNYQIMISDTEQETLKIQGAEDAVICVILRIAQDPTESTANLLGPIVMNTVTRIGMQMVVVNPNYSTKHYIFRPGGDGDEQEAHNAGA